MRKLTDLQQSIDDFASDAMSDALDMDVGVGELSDAASIELSEHLHEILSDELVRLARICGPDGSASFSIRSYAARGFEVAITLYPKSDTKPGSLTAFAATIPEAIAKAETEAAEWAEKHPVVTAADLGLGEAA